VLATRALADAVPPAPTDCPGGHVGVTSHGGPACVKEAPEDCPPGWRGVLGGSCMLTPCAADASCPAGEACIEHSVCLQPFEHHFYDYGEEPPGASPGQEQGAGAPRGAREFFAGPPAPRVKRPEPIFRYDATNLCAPQAPCVSPRTCQTEKLCAPRGKRAVAYLGSNVQSVRVARTTEEALTQNDAQSSEGAAPPRGGCAACAVRGGAAGSAWVWAVIGLAATVARRLGRRARVRARRW
jgi:hypothetical protein